MEHPQLLHTQHLHLHLFHNRHPAIIVTLLANHLLLLLHHHRHLRNPRHRLQSALILHQLRPQPQLYLQPQCQLQNQLHLQRQHPIESLAYPLLLHSRQHQDHLPFLLLLLHHHRHLRNPRHRLQPALILHQLRPQPLLYLQPQCQPQNQLRLQLQHLIQSLAYPLLLHSRQHQDHLPFLLLLLHHHRHLRNSRLRLQPALILHQLRPQPLLYLQPQCQPQNQLRLQLQHLIQSLAYPLLLHSRQHQDHLPFLGLNRRLLLKPQILWPSLLPRHCQR